jgi:hypothetical protein
MEAREMNDLNDSEWENRMLCPDGKCIGVIGEDGRCKECGLLYEGTLPVKESPAAAGPIEPDTPAPPDSPPEPEHQTDLKASPDEEWENRILCADGNCIGIIGPNGVCKVCGKPYGDSTKANRR